MNMQRRIRTIGLIVAIALLAGAALAMRGARQGPLPDDNLHPIQGDIRSVDGILSTTLEARDTAMDLGGVQVQAAIYNGNYAGPVLRVHPGDLMRIHFVNHLDTPSNLHFHGLISSPQGNSDNAHLQVPPGESFDYEVKIADHQPPGLYWYPDHTHGIAEQHVMRGLSGALLVEGFARQFDGLAGIEEQLLVVKDYAFDNDFNHSDDPRVAVYYNDRITTINGLTAMRIGMHPGQTQLWRLSNQGANLISHLTLEGHRFRIIGTDGQVTTAETVVDTLDIAPASRVDVLVDAGAPGTYQLIARGLLTGTDEQQTVDRAMGEVIVAGEPTLPIATLRRFPDPHDLRALSITGRRTLTLSQSRDSETYFIDTRKFDHARTDIRVALGSVEEWIIRNDSDDFHSFHIHQMSFQPIAVNGKPIAFGGRLDNIRVPERGSVTLLLAFTDPLILGRFMYHCHVLKHEDRGMMGNIEIYQANTSAQAHAGHVH